jgi:succinoglycan biosynthesis transport protein ExoP
MELKQYFEVLKKWWWLVVASTLVATLSAYLAVSRIPRTYEATTTLMIGQSLQQANPTNEDLWISQQLAQTYRQLATRQPILRGAAEQLELSYVPKVEDVSAWLVPGTQLLSISVLDTNPERARALADAIAEQLILQTPNEIAEEQARQTFVRTQLETLQENIQTTEEEIGAEQEKLNAASSARAIQQYQDNITALQQKLASYQATYASLMQSVEGRTNYISVFEPAVTPTEPVSPRVIETLLMAAAIGLCLAVAGIFLIEFLDDSVKTPDDMEQITGLPTLGAIGHFEGEGPDDRLLAVEGSPSFILEAYRALRTNLQVSSIDEPLRTLVVTSPSAVEGKSTTAANLGAIMALSGKSVILVDADLRRSTLHKHFKLPNSEGLTNALMQDEPTADGWLQDTEIENLRLLASGPLPPNPPELLGSKKMHRLIEKLAEEADIIIFDTPPLLPVTDATVLAIEADGVILVSEANHTRRGQLRQAVENLRRTEASVLGTVLNNMSPRNGGSYYYNYDYGDSPKSRRKRPKKD